MSLTKSSFLEAAKPDGPVLLGDFLGLRVYVKACSELKRSRRGASMFDDKGQLKKNYRERARVYSIIDSVCDEKGRFLFDESDVQALLQLDSVKLDPITKAISEWVQKTEGNDQGESAE